MKHDRLSHATVRGKFLVHIAGDHLKANVVGAGIKVLLDAALNGFLVTDGKHRVDQAVAATIRNTELSVPLAADG